MTKKAGPSIYIPTDKNVFDALQHKKITQSSLVYFLRKRGILVYLDAPKQELIEKISALTLSYKDFDWIAKFLENPNRKDKTTHARLNGKLDAGQVKRACDAVKANLTTDGDDSVKVSKNGNITTLKVTYVDHDFTKTEMRQRSIKTCEIEMEYSADGVVMKIPSTKKGKEVSAQLYEKLQYQAKEAGAELDYHSISLASVTDAKARSGFFDLLIKNLPNFILDTVTSVDVFNFSHERSDEFEDDEQEARLASYINKAALNGAGVLNSKEFNQLHSQGFYIYRIVWLAKHNGEDNPKVEFEAQFSNPSECTNFNYKVRGVYHVNSRTGEHNISRVGVTPRENKEYSLELRKGSEFAFAKAMQEFGG